MKIMETSILTASKNKKAGLTGPALFDSVSISLFVNRAEYVTRMHGAYW